MIYDGPDSLCPRCNHRWPPVVFDLHGDVSQPGGITVCPHCGSVGVIEDSMDVRPATADDVFDALTYQQVVDLAILVLKRRTELVLAAVLSP